MNEVKHANYKEQMKRLNLAIKNRFLLEAILIEYGMLEDRTEAFIRYSLGENKLDKYQTINRKINKLKSLVGDKYKNINRYLSLELLDDLHNWKERRNSIIHGLMKRINSAEELEAIALEGLNLVKIFNSKSMSFKRKLEKI
jgi:hypothetical protein